MTHPFDDPNGSFYALLNKKGQYSLWPAFLDIPGGWEVVFGVAGRDACTEYIETHWQSVVPSPETVGVE